MISVLAVSVAVGLVAGVSVVVLAAIFASDTNESW